MIAEQNVTDLMGWQNTRWGMTAAEIQDALAGKALDLTPKKYRHPEGEWKGHGPYYQLMRYIELGNTEFEVRFMIDPLTNVLASVILRNSIREDRVTAKEANTIKKIITEKYGKPARNGSS